MALASLLSFSNSAIGASAMTPSFPNSATGAPTESENGPRTAQFNNNDSGHPKMEMNGQNELSSRDMEVPAH